MRTRWSLWPFFACVGLLMGWTGLCVFQSLAPNALSQGGPATTALRDAVLAIAPQRWEFFTKSPQAAQILAYRVGTGESALSLPQSRSSNAFGLSRAQRAQGPELAALHQQVEKWSTCRDKSDSTACLARTKVREPELLRNDAAFRTLCGELVLTQEKPTPFEFRDFGLSEFRVVRAAHVEVRCS